VKNEGRVCFIIGKKKKKVGGAADNLKKKRDTTKRIKSVGRHS